MKANERSMMTRPYDVEAGLREVAQTRVNPDALNTEMGRLGDQIADGFRADFDTDLDMETVGAALVIAAATLLPLQRDTSPSVLVGILAMAGENLARTARARAAESADLDERLAAALADPRWSEHALTWHPADAELPPVPLPLFEHISSLYGVGEFRLTTREVPPASETAQVSGG